MQWLFYAVLWLAISGAAGAIASWAFGLSFWAVALIVGVSLLANGLIAAWEERR